MSEVGGIINFFYFRLYSSFSRRNRNARSIHPRGGACQMHEELRAETRDSARRFFLYILGDAGKLFVPVLNFSANTKFFRRKNPCRKKITSNKTHA